MPRVCVLTLRKPSSRWFAAQVARAFGPERCVVIWQATPASRSPAERDAWLRERLGEAGHARHVAEESRLGWLDETSRECALQAAEARFGASDAVLRRVTQTSVGDINAEPQALIDAEADALLMFGGPILGPAIFEIPITVRLNQHTGWIPEYRGAAALEQAVLAGDWGRLGTTIHELTPRLDLGRVVARCRTTVYSGEPLSQVQARLTVLGTHAMIEAARRMLAGEPLGEPPEGDGRVYRSFDLPPSRAAECRARVAHVFIKEGISDRLRGDRLEIDGVARRVHVRIGNLSIEPPLDERMRRGGAPGIVNVYYHGIAPAGSPATALPHTVPLEVFVRHMEFLRSWLAPMRLADALGGAAGLDRPVFTVSFDDGLRSVREHAWAVLRAMEIPFTVFVNPSVLGNRDRLWEQKVADLRRIGALEFGGRSDLDVLERMKAAFHMPWVDGLDELHARLPRDEGAPLYLSAQDLGEMRPLCEVGNHGDRHLPLAALDEPGKREEINSPFDELSALPGFVPLYAAAYGIEEAVDQESIRIARERHAHVLMVGNRVAWADDVETASTVPRIALRTMDPAAEIEHAVGGARAASQVEPRVAGRGGFVAERSRALAALVRAKHDELAAHGPLGLIGAGQFTLWLLHVIGAERRDRISFIFDDHKGGTSIAGMPVVDDPAVCAHARTVVVSTDCHFAVLAGRARELFPGAEVRSYFEDVCDAAARGRR